MSVALWLGPVQAAGIPCKRVKMQGRGLCIKQCYVSACTMAAVYVCLLAVGRQVVVQAETGMGKNCSQDTGCSAHV